MFPRSAGTKGRPTIARALLVNLVGLVPLLLRPAPLLPAASTISPPNTVTVAGGAPRTIGEPVAAQTRDVSVVVATTFAESGSVVRVFSRTPESGWVDAGTISPPGFGASFDPSLAELPDGSVVVVAGVGELGAGCVGGGSVALATVSGTGQLGAARVIDDQSGTGYFADRPTVAAGADGQLWVGWSRGPDSTSCQPIGSADTPVVMHSADYGRDFGAPIDLAPDAQAAFGLRLVALSGGRVLAAWTQEIGDGQDALMIDRLQGVAPVQVLAGPAPPLVLPGASFYDFPEGDVAATGDGGFAAVLPVWLAGRSVLELATGEGTEVTSTSAVLPAPGADLLLPVIAPVAPDKFLLLAATHLRVGDALGYATAVLSVNSGALAAGPLLPVTAQVAGPGFFEIGEELYLQPAPAGLVAAVVLAGPAGATLQELTWRVTTPATPAASASVRASATASARASTTPAARDRTGGGPPWWAVLVLILGGIALALVARVRQVARRRR